MSSIELGAFPADPPPPDQPLTPEIGDAARSFSQIVIRDTFRRLSAKIGAAWIVIVFLLATFAPLLCSSFPLAVKSDGHWSSPLLLHLGKNDAIVLITGISILVLAALTKVALHKRLILLAAIFLATVAFAWFFVNPNTTDDLAAYRNPGTLSHLQAKIDTLVPYSIDDSQFDHLSEPPSRAHWMGTDYSGADVLAGMLHGCQIALSVGIISTSIALLIGCTIGAMMGYFSGVVDILGMRALEIFAAVPTLFLLLMFSAVAGPYAHNLYLIMAIIGLTGWDGYARFVRAEFLKLRHQDFVQAAIASGLPLRTVLFRHMLPNALTPVLVSVSFGVASAILAEAVLSFLGLGLINEPSWGRLLNEALSVGGDFYWWLAMYPGMAIFLTVFAYNLIGESLRDAADPKLRK